MKIAVLSESSADEAAVWTLVPGLLGSDAQRIDIPSPSVRGWKGVFKAIEPTLRHLHFRTDADALVVTLDSDESPVHRKVESPSTSCDPHCRMCCLQNAIKSVQVALRPRQGRGPILTAVGMAVPAIEAWCVCKTNAHVTESAWIQALPSKKFPYSKQDLKRKLYGMESPPLDLEKEVLLNHFQQWIKDNQLPRLEQLFPIGFGSLAEEVRRWLS